jgi:hypothetical protein
VIPRVLVAAATILAATGRAWGQPVPADHPFVVPQRDVDVLYAVPVQGPLPAGQPQGQAAVAQRMRFAVSPTRQRVDPPGPGTYMITDYAAGRMIVVQPAQHLATSLPAPGSPIAPHGVRATGDYKRLGVQAIAGAACTDWQTTDQSGNTSIVCLTEDGVLLRAMQAGRIMLQAVQLAYAPQAAAVFAVPDGYTLQAAPR